MKLSRRSSPEAATDAEPADEGPAVDLGKGATQGKGRPTPKRRDSQGTSRGPVTAPKTRKEAYARQKQQTRDQRTTSAAAKPRSAAEQRAALKRGDPDALPRRDQGKTRKLARDYVDSKRMFSNYLLWLLPLLILTSAVPVLARYSPVVLVLFAALVVEWYFTGKRIRAMAKERFGEADGTTMSIGFYAGSRAYLPRRWRLPGAQVERGDEI